MPATKRPARNAQAAAERHPAAPSAADAAAYWEHSAHPVKEHGELFETLTDETPHAYPARWQQPAGFARADRFARFLLLHYPRYSDAHYFDPATGHATDQTLHIVERAVQAARPDLQLVFAQMFDWVGDLYDGGAQIGFDFERDFYERLTIGNQRAWRDSKVRALAAVLVDEMVLRGRVGALVTIAGANPTKVGVGVRVRGWL